MTMYSVTSIIKHIVYLSNIINASYRF